MLPSPTSGGSTFPFSSRLLLAGRWHKAFHAHVGDDVAVMFIIMRCVETEHIDFGELSVEEADFVRRMSIGHSVVGFVAIGERRLERVDDLSFGLLGLLDRRMIRSIA